MSGRFRFMQWRRRRRSWRVAAWVARARVPKLSEWSIRVFKNL